NSWGTSVCSTMLLLRLRQPHPLTPLPYTTLFRSARLERGGGRAPRPEPLVQACAAPGRRLCEPRARRAGAPARAARGLAGGAARDRKSTRLNSSHVAISYAVFCLKKKKNHALIAA